MSNAEEAGAMVRMVCAAFDHGCACGANACEHEAPYKEGTAQRMAWEYGFQTGYARNHCSDMPSRTVH